jgi:amidase
MQQAMASGRVTSRELVQQYLMRIALYDKKLNAVITVNPNALREAEERDRERTQGRLIGPLHGIPIALKDNIHTTNMPTTGGALAFEGFVPPYEATLVKSLRGAARHHRQDRHDRARQLGGRRADADAIGLQSDQRLRHESLMIRGAIRARQRSTAAPRCRRADRAPASAPTANFWAANVGTETSGSLLSPPP